MNQEKLCKRCKKPVEVNATYYDTFEQMHWLCFHLEFEHEGDPDEACGDPSCPWLHIEVFQEKLRQLGLNPEQLLSDGLVKRHQS